MQMFCHLCIEHKGDVEPAVVPQAKLGYNIKAFLHQN